jgi:hypothetical protein
MPDSASEPGLCSGARVIHRIGTPEEAIFEATGKRIRDLSLGKGLLA